MTLWSLNGSQIIRSLLIFLTDLIHLAVWLNLIFEKFTLILIISTSISPSDSLLLGIKFRFTRCSTPPHLLGLQDVVLQVLHQMRPIVFVEEKVFLLLWQRRHDTIWGQEGCDRLIQPVIQQVHHTCVLNTRHTFNTFQCLTGQINILHLQHKINSLSSVILSFVLDSCFGAQTSLVLVSPTDPRWEAKPPTVCFRDCRSTNFR